MNASLITSVADYLTIAAHQSYGNYGNMTVLLFNATLGAIVLDPSLTNVSVLGPAIGDLFGDDVFSIPQACAYPISGQYGFLNRLLYYCLILFAVLAASKSWLCWAALGIAMSYSASACVHAFALFTRYRYDWPDYDSAGWYTMPQKYYGDIDLAGMFPILVAGCIALPPILNWSYLLKGSKGAKPVVVLWGIMMFAAVIPGLVFTVRGYYPFEVTNQVTYCPTNAAKNCTFADLYNDGNGIYSSTTYDRCQCKDTCGAVVPSGFPFRHGQSLQAVLTSDQIDKLGEKSSVEYAFFVNTLLLVFILAHGILGLIEASWTQQHVRDTIFRRLSGSTRRGLRKGLVSKMRYYIGKYTAAFFFVSAIVVTVMSPPVFISSVIINEIVTWNWPVAEQYDAVGQWGPLVATAFAIVAATVQVLSTAWQDRNSAKSSKTPLSESVPQGKRASIKNLWKEIWAMLHEFKYWLLEASHHEPLLQSPKVSERTSVHTTCLPTTTTTTTTTTITSISSSRHNTFKSTPFSTSTCDRCKHPARSVTYQCHDCDRGYCTTFWPRARKHGARLIEDTTGDEQLLIVSKQHDAGPHSANSSPSLAPTPTAYTPLPHIEESGGFAFATDGYLR